MASSAAANGASSIRVASPTNDSAFSGHSIRSGATSTRQNGTASKKVVTAPPWARHEPPSPQASTSNILVIEQTPSILSHPDRPFDKHLEASEIASTHASTIEPSHWWTFNLPLPLPLRKNSTSNDKPPTSKANTIRERPRAAWLFDRAQVRTDRDDEVGRAASVSSTTHEGSQLGSRRRGMRLQLPRQSAIGPFTLSQNQTPGWETPWAPIPQPEEAHVRPSNGTMVDDNALEQGWEDGTEKSRKKGQRRQTWKTWLLQSSYVPLIIRLINISFTTVTLAVAVSIRNIERKNNLVGAIGSSPLLAIIFAPPTLVHVMVAIYLEYFGKPLGLWSTSAKLLHTVSEMVFISMWSASLSLCFDNYFTSPLRCAPESATFWWNRIERTATIPLDEDAPGGEICERQIALICLVFFGAILYSSNLIVSLFRIFEKVKYHSDRTTGA